MASWREWVDQLIEVRRRKNGYVEGGLYIFSHIHTRSSLFKVLLPDEESGPVEEALGRIDFYKNYGPIAPQETMVEVDTRLLSLLDEAL